MREQHSEGRRVGQQTFEVAIIWPMKRTDFIMLAKFAKSEEFEIGLEAILWDLDTIDDRLRRQLRINWP